MRCLTLILCLAALPAAAQQTYPSGKTVDCYCTDKSGARVELGETICLTVDGRMFLAQCQMSLNVPMWREVTPSCLSSGLLSEESSGLGFDQDLLQPGAVDAHI